VVCIHSCFISALPRPSSLQVQRRQALDLDLIESTPDPDRQPDDDTNYNPKAAIQSVIAEVEGHPTPLESQPIDKRNIIISPYIGYTDNIRLGDAAIDAPLDCNNKVRTCTSLLNDFSR
jgi:hypothetical protein